MLYKDKTTYVSEGIMQFMIASINQHHADKEAVYTKVKALCNEQLNLMGGQDPDRNK
tara:strand:+ start:3147 stop:3317 length:171 start_codon:yes stop_codon:yes gene_type:complete